MSDEPAAGVESRGRIAVDVVICIDHDALTRVQPVIRHLCVGLVDHSARVRILTSSPESLSLASLGPVEVIKHRELIWPLRARRLREIVETLSARPPNVIFAVSAGTFAVASEIAEAFDTEVVAQVKAIRDADLLGTVAASRLAHVIAASEPLRTYIRERTDIPDDKCSLIRPGVLRGTHLTCFENPDATPSLVSTAGLDDRSGVDVIIDAVAKVRDDGHQLLTFLLGAGKREATLRAKVRAKDLLSRVTFARPTADINEVLRGTDVFVMPPGDEDILARPLQALASGTAVICFEGGVTDCFHDGETALVCKQRNAAALAAAIERLLEDHALAHRLANNAIEYVKKNHQMSTMADLTMRAFQGVAVKSQTFRIGN